LLKLVNSLLDFSRIEAGRVQALYEPTDLARLTTELASHFHSAAQRAGLQLKIECPALPEPVYVDREMWEKIVLNLMSNAFKHTFQGVITVRLESADGGGVRLSVKDTGVGIPAEEIPKLFERFHRVKGAASRTHEGTGIGLSLVRELVQLHSGAVHVGSEVGSGSRFVVELKGGSAHLPTDKVGQSAEAGRRGGESNRSTEAFVQEAAHWSPATTPVKEWYLADGAAAALAPTAPTGAQAPTAARAQAPATPPGAQVPTVAVSGSRPRVLLADDNADMRHYIARILGKHYDVLAVSDGQAALDAARASPPDLVLSDVMMPRLDGFGLVKALRSEEKTQTLPIILLSARAGEESAVESLGAGASDYLVKPFSARELLARVRTHVELSRLQRAWESELERRIEERTAELRQAQQLALQQERLSALGQMASGIAHDINNAISPISLYVESLLQTDQTLSERARQCLPIVLRAIDDVASTVARMREFYRGREPQLVLLPADLNSLANQVLELTRARWSDMPLQRGVVISVATELTPELPFVMGIESEVREALTNLVFNAVDAMPSGGTLTLKTAAVGGGVYVEVGDTGVGMDEATRQRCLEPFFTTKGERGTGLGLAMVYGFVQRHGADIQIESAPGQGTRIRIVYPVSEPVASSHTSLGTKAAAPRAHLRILVIDDDPLVLDALKETLEAEGHVVVSTNDSRHGVDTFHAARGKEEPFEVVVTDLGMPHLDGRGVAKSVKEASPHTPVILLTGWGQRPGADVESLPHVDRVLGKPPKAKELRAALAECFAEGMERERKSREG
jgi:signal transduction histidine kinase